MCRSNPFRLFSSTRSVFAAKRDAPTKRETKAQVEARAKLTARRAARRAAENPEKMTIAEAAQVLRVSRVFCRLDGW